MKTIFVIFGLATLAACATFGPQHDPNEVQITGRVMAKALYDGKSPGNSAVITRTALLNAISLPQGIVFIPVPRSSRSSGERYQYDIRLDNGTQVRVVNFHQGFDIGDCVTVFLSENVDRYPPRMAFSTVNCKS